MKNMISQVVKDVQLTRSGQATGFHAGRLSGALDGMFIESHQRGQKRKSFEAICRSELFPRVLCELQRRLGRELTPGEESDARLLAAAAYLAPVTSSLDASGAKVFHSRTLTDREIDSLLSMARQAPELADEPAQLALALVMGWTPATWTGDTPWAGRPFISAVQELLEFAKPAALRFLRLHFAPLFWQGFEPELVQELVFLAIAVFVSLRPARSRYQAARLLSTWRKGRTATHLSLNNWWIQALLGHGANDASLEAGRFAQSLLGEQLIGEGWLALLPVAYVRQKGKLIEYHFGDGNRQVIEAVDRLLIVKSIVRFFTAHPFVAFTEPGFYPDHVKSRRKGRKLYFAAPEDGGEIECPFAHQWVSGETTCLQVRRAAPLDAEGLVADGSEQAADDDLTPAEIISQEESDAEVIALRKLGLSRNQTAAVMLSRMGRSIIDIAQALGVDVSQTQEILDGANEKLENRGAAPHGA